MKKLGLKKEILTELSPADLQVVAGGAPLPSLGLSRNCTYTCTSRVTDGCTSAFTDGCTGTFTNGCITENCTGC